MYNIFYNGREDSNIEFCRETSLARLKKYGGGRVGITSVKKPTDSFLKEICDLTGFYPDEDGLFTFSKEDVNKTPYMISLLLLFLGKSTFVNTKICPETIFDNWPENLATSI